MPAPTPPDDTATTITTTASTTTAPTTAGATLPAPTIPAPTLPATMRAGVTVDLTGDPAGEDQMVLTRHRPHPRTVLVRVSGEVDLCTAPRLRRVLDDACRLLAPTTPADPTADPAEVGAPTRGQVVCDLTAVAFLGAKGLDALTAADQTARAHGAQLRVVTGTPMVRRVLAVAGLDRHLDTSWQLDDLGELAAPVTLVSAPQAA